MGMAPQYPRSPGRTRPQTISMARSTRPLLSWGRSSEKPCGSLAESVSGEHVSGRHGLTLELTQGAQLPSPEWVDAGHTVLDPPDVQQPVLEVDLIPAERAQLGDSQAVPVGDPDHGGIAVPVPVLPGGSDQALGFLGGQVLAGAALGMRNGPGRDCPILRDWRGDLGRGAAHRTRALSHARLSRKGAKMGQFS